MSYTQEETEALAWAELNAIDAEHYGCYVCELAEVLAAALRSREALLAKKDQALKKISESGPVWERTRENLIEIAEDALVPTGSPSEARP